MRSQRGPGFSLNIKPAATGDSGTYFCLVNGKPEPFSAYTLAVQGNNQHQTSDSNSENSDLEKKILFMSVFKTDFLTISYEDILANDGVIRMKTSQPWRITTISLSI